MALFYLCALLSLGLLISTRAQTQMEAQQMAQMLFLPGVFLSGYIFPFEGLPFVLRGIGLLFPATHMIAIMRGVVLRDASIVDLWPHVAALLAMSVVLVWLGARSVRRSRPERRISAYPGGRWDFCRGCWAAGRRRESSARSM